MNGKTRRLIEASLNDQLEEFEEIDFQPVKKRNEPPPQDDRRQKQKEWGRAIARSNREKRKASQFEEHAR